MSKFPKCWTTPLKTYVFHKRLMFKLSSGFELGRYHQSLFQFISFTNQSWSSAVWLHSKTFMHDDRNRNTITKSVQNYKCPCCLHLSPLCLSGKLKGKLWRHILSFHNNQFNATCFFFNLMSGISNLPSNLCQPAAPSSDWPSPVICSFSSSSIPYSISHHPDKLSIHSISLALLSYLSHNTITKFLPFPGFSIHPSLLNLSSLRC